MNNKTHYRKVFKSDHLGSADLEEMLEEKKRLVFKIKVVKQEYGVKVAGKRIDANIAYFEDTSIKPLVLNATNSKQMAKFASSKFVEDWGGITVELYIDSSVKMKGETVGGVRIKSELPVLEKHELTPESIFWEKAKAKVLTGEADFDSLNVHYMITEENFDLICKTS